MREGFWKTWLHLLKFVNFLNVRFEIEMQDKFIINLQIILHKQLKTQISYIENIIHQKGSGSYLLEIELSRKLLLDIGMELKKNMSMSLFQEIISLFSRFFLEPNLICILYFSEINKKSFLCAGWYILKSCSLGF